MTLLHFPTSLFSSPSLHPVSFASLRPNPKPLPARDRVIDFGKHKGKMLGTLPSAYLTWVSRNLRARDFQDWAGLADQVLSDPVYRDRIEWESAERILAGDTHRTSSCSRSDSPVADLLELSDRFGWDNDDKAAWARLDFDLLGTSKGGRIPRRKTNVSRTDETGSSEKAPGSRIEREGGVLGGDFKVPKRDEMGSEERKSGFPNRGLNGSRNGEVGLSNRGRGLRNERKGGILGGVSTGSSGLRNGGMGPPAMSSGLRSEREAGSLGSSLGGRKVGFLRNGGRFSIGGKEGEEPMGMRGKREERRERRRLKRTEQLEMLRREVGVEEEERGSRVAIANGAFTEKRGLGGGEFVNPFPGRGALLDKIKRNGN